mmetsp:Transcript_32092/g.73875  ORF Transcript_32092/g.73875 Transcript_32092/m.73875 type:complete len:246 (-) Transcript_32092:658-1395(-)
MTSFKGDPIIKALRKSSSSCGGILQIEPLLKTFSPECWAKSPCDASGAGCNVTFCDVPTRHMGITGKSRCRTWYINSAANFSASAASQQNQRPFASQTWSSICSGSKEPVCSLCSIAYKPSRIAFHVGVEFKEIPGPHLSARTGILAGVLLEKRIGPRASFEACASGLLMKSTAFITLGAMASASATTFCSHPAAWREFTSSFCSASSRLSSRRLSSCACDARTSSFSRWSSSTRLRAASSRAFA